MPLAFVTRTPWERRPNWWPWTGDPELVTLNVHQPCITNGSMAVSFHHHKWSIRQTNVASSVDHHWCYKLVSINTRKNRGVGQTCNSCTNFYPYSSPVHACRVFILCARHKNNSSSPLKPLSRYPASPMQLPPNLIPLLTSLPTFHATFHFSLRFLFLTSFPTCRVTSTSVVITDFLTALGLLSQARLWRMHIALSHTIPSTGALWGSELLAIFQKPSILHDLGTIFIAHNCSRHTEI
jgi:hypothetical protein